MKSLFKCEKCGKVFDDMSECEKCENTHYTFRNANCWDDEMLPGQLDEMSEYKEGQEEPDKIVVWFVREYWDDTKSEWVRERRCAKYKLMSSFERPLVVTNE